MKSFRLKKFSGDVGVGYTVHLGNGYAYDFATQKQVQKFLVDASAHLNDVADELNELRQTAYGFLCRYNWYFWDFKTNKRNNSYANTQANRLFNDINETFEQAYRSQFFENGNYLPFNNLIRVAKQLREVLGIVNAVASTRNVRGDIHTMERLMGRCNEIVATLKQYDVKKASRETAETDFKILQVAV